MIYNIFLDVYNKGPRSLYEMFNSKKMARQRQLFFELTISFRSPAPKVPKEATILSGDPKAPRSEATFLFYN